MDDLSRVTGRVFGKLLKPNAADGAPSPAGHHHHPAPSLAPDLDAAPDWKRVTEFGGRKGSKGGDALQPAAE
jgi:HAE1 family hydrophobic/amphiphilic exporter-1